MTSFARRRTALAVALTLTIALALSGCGSRLPYSKVLAENAALGSSANSTQTTVASSTRGGSSNAAGGATGSGGSTSSGQPAGSSGGSSTGTQPGAGGGGSSSSSGVSTGPATGSTVNVGQMGTDSGLVGSFLGGARTSAEIWANYVNQHGGLNGHRVNLITEDDGGDPSTGLSEAQTLVQQDHVVALIASDNALSEPTVAPYLDQMGVPTIGGDSVLSQWYTNPDFFPDGPSVRVTTDAVLQASINQGHKKVAVLACVEFALICSNVEQIIAHDTPLLGGQVVYSASVSLAQPDFTSECLGAEQAGANMVYLALDPASQDRVAEDCANQNYHPQYASTGLTFTPALLSTPNTDGELGASDVFPFSAQGPETAQFDQAVEEATGGPPTTELESFGWVAGLVLQAAAKDFPASNPTAADVVAGLDQIRNDTFGGLTVPITYVSGQPTTSPTCSYLLEIVKGSFVDPDGLNTQCVPPAFASVYPPPG